MKTSEVEVVESWDQPGAIWHHSKGATCSHDDKLRRVKLGTYIIGNTTTVLYGKQCVACKGLLYA